MGLFRKNTDAISERARTLNTEIAALEAQIKQLASRAPQRGAPEPRLRSTAIPHGETVPHSGAPGPESARTAPNGPIFEDVDRDELEGANAAQSTPDHFNELGMRKYDLPAFMQRVRRQFRGPSTSNPKLVSYLAAGGVQGLRPLRHEKRVARYRFIALVSFFFIILLGIISYSVRHR